MKTHHQSNLHAENPRGGWAGAGRMGQSKGLCPDSALKGLPGPSFLLGAVAPSWKSREWDLGKGHFASNTSSSAHELPEDTFQREAPLNADLVMVKQALDTDYLENTK